MSRYIKSLINMTRTLISTILIWSSLYGYLLSQQINKGKYLFTIEMDLERGPVEDQGQTGTCWSFSTSSFLESELARTNDRLIDLSEMYFVRQAYLDKAEKYLRYQGKNQFSEGSLAHDVMLMLASSGAMPEEVYTGLPQDKQSHDHSGLVGELKSYLDSLISTRSIPNHWRTDFNEILDSHLGVAAETFSYMGKNYTPTTFADEYVDIDPTTYVSLSSFSHHPTTSRFILEVPDNYARQYFVNVKLEDLLSIVDHALDQGMTLVWDCDVSEKGFSARQGLAILPALDQGDMQSAFDAPVKEQKVTAEMRQEEFDSYSLTDDHLMHIVGRAYDQNNVPYYMVKNSWGSSLGFDGYLLASQSYVAMNTISIMVHQDGIPHSIMKEIQHLVSTDGP